MIRLCNSRLIIPKGDTGFFSLPTEGVRKTGDIAIFSVYDKLTQETVLEKIVDASDESISFFITHDDTAQLEAKKYYWDIKLYKEPQYNEDGDLIGAEEINSYYSAWRLPECIIKEVAQNV